MKFRRQPLIALSVLIVGTFTALAIIATPPRTDRQEKIVKLPPVKIAEVKPERLRMDVRSQGRVTAHTEIDLVAEVSGHVIKVSPAFVNGGFFLKGDLLVAIDPSDYNLRVAQAHARVMEARYLLMREEAESEQSRNEWQHLGQGDPSVLTQRIPQLEERRARLTAEQVELENARLLRQRTEIRAPFDGRVRSREIGMGQYLVSGTILERIYSSSLAEIRLPLSTNELAFLDLPRASLFPNPSKAAKVELTAVYEGRNQSWQGHVVRSEGVVDMDTGMMTVVAQIPDPFNLAANRSESLAIEGPVAGLPVGLFVQATIEGRWLDNLVILPSVALQKNNRVAIVDHENRLRFRAVEVLRSERERIIISAGLNAGEQVFISGLFHPVEGMQVTPVPLTGTADKTSVRKAEDDAGTSTTP